jgi:hypothetical protein
VCEWQQFRRVPPRLRAKGGVIPPGAEGDGNPQVDPQPQLETEPEGGSGELAPDVEVPASEAPAGEDPSDTGPSPALVPAA